MADAAGDASKEPSTQDNVSMSWCSAQDPTCKHHHEVLGHASCVVVVTNASAAVMPQQVSVLSAVAYPQVSSLNLLERATCDGVVA
jgi:hypothetical protein